MSKKGPSFIYLAEREDLLPLVAKWYFEEWGHLKEGRTLDAVQADLQAYLNKDKIPLLMLAVAGETIMGAAHLKYREMDIYPEKTHWLGGVYTNKEHRGRGTATRLVVHMVSVARGLGVRALYLQTEALSGGIYARLGWCPVEKVHYHGRNVLVMENRLDG